MRIAQIDRRLDRPSNWICQSFENCSEHAQKADITPGNRNMFRRHFYLGFVFDPISFYSLLLLFSNSSETISTKGMKDLLCVTLATSFSLTFSCRARWISYSGTIVGCFLFCCGIFSNVHCLPYSHRRKSIAITLLWFLWKLNDDELFRPPNVSLKYFLTVQRLFCLNLSLH